MKEENNNNKIPIEMHANATKRSCLVRNLFETIVICDAHEKFNNSTKVHDAFRDVMAGGTNENASWRLKIVNATMSSMPHDVSSSSNKNERELVDLKNPDCIVCTLEGLIGNIFLARLVAEGFQVRSCFMLFVFFNRK